MIRIYRKKKCYNNNSHDICIFRIRYHLLYLIHTTNLFLKPNCIKIRTNECAVYAFILYNKRRFS